MRLSDEAFIRIQQAISLAAAFASSALIGGLSGRLVWTTLDNPTAGYATAFVSGAAVFAIIRYITIRSR